ncbi:MAG TPA: PcfB family protein [Lachnospiraceae bacterium]|nr:PcfB family protein [Lachnospiraceae bacterium]
MNDEVNSKTVAFYVRGAKMTASILSWMMKKYLQKVDQNKSIRKQQAAARKRMPPTGKISVRELAKQNAGMKNIEITPENIKSFERVARKYGINYALKKDKTKDPPVYMVFFKGRDEDAITAAFREYTGQALKKANRPTIHKRLVKFRDVIKASKDQNRTKHKHQEQTL